MSSPPAVPPSAETPSGGDAAALTRVGVYRRTIRASLERIWENVLDWEHLPWLHRESFAEIQLQRAGAWGWRVDAVTAQGLALELELSVERDASRYVSRTVAGEGAGTEIWTQLCERSSHETDIEVEFCLPDIQPDAVERVGDAYKRLYAKLWDQDEAMMREREMRLVSRRAAQEADLTDLPGMELALGDLEPLRAKLPLRVEFLGEPIWLVELEGVLLTHTAVCPHLLGPLPPAGSDDERAETVECPWHGHRFDARTGSSCDGHKLRMKATPQVVVEGNEVRLVAPLAKLDA